MTRTDYRKPAPVPARDAVRTIPEQDAWLDDELRGLRLTVQQLVDEPPVTASAVMMARHFATANLTSTKTITSTNTFALYVGRPGKALTSATLRFRVTTAAVTITWAEVGLATGSINIGAGPTLTPRAFTNVATVVNSTGLKSVAITATDIGPADDLWVLLGGQASTAYVVRAQSIADDILVGQQASAVTRPSLNIGTPVVFAAEAPTVLAPWAALVV